MLEEAIGTMGLVNFALLTVALSLLVVIVLFMSYFRTLISIANFAYPNAKFRAKGTPFIEEEIIDDLIESRNLNEIFSEIKKNGYQLSKKPSAELETFEKQLDKSNIDLVKEALYAAPDRLKPFVKTWLLRYDVMMVKRAIKSATKGIEKEKLEDILYPVNIIDRKMIDKISNSKNIQQMFNSLSETKLGDVLKEKKWDGNFFKLDTELDRFAFKELKNASLKVETEQQSVIKYFVGKYTDLMNLKIIFRGLREGIDKEALKKSLLPDGRELARWKLENMVEAKNLKEALVELNGTSYQELSKEDISSSNYEIEYVIDVTMIDLASEIMSQYILNVGPILKYLVGKEYELRNLKALVRGVKEGVDSNRIKRMMILEGYQ
ncbi:MAG: V-type ATPase subunit [Candidatus Saliniplasma sp.]